MTAPSPSLAWSVCADPAIGFDVSRWQGRIVPWSQAVHLGARWAVVKTWHGRGLVDPNVDQYDGAKGEGLLVGRYGWWLPDADLAMQVGAWCANPTPHGEIPLTIDVEEPGTAARGRSLLSRLEYVIERVSDRLGQRPIIYTGAWYWTGYLQGLDSQLVSECPLWLAAYPRKAATGTRYQEAVAEVCGGVMPAIPRPWADRSIEPVMWQFDGDHGLTLPNGTDVDVNTAAWGKLRALAGRDTLPAPPDSDAPTWPGTPTAKSSDRLRAVDAPIIDGPATPLRAGEGEHTVPLDEADFEGVT